MCDDVTYMYDDVTYMYDDVTYMYDDVTYMYDDVTHNRYKVPMSMFFCFSAMSSMMYLWCLMLAVFNNIAVSYI